jgi:asparagine N-glycosylation enzyme membrane subunit Stt3
MKGLGARILDLALCVAAAALLLQWAWNILRPLLPMLIGMAAVASTLLAVILRRRRW